jgi:hypothetical protein
MWWLCANLRTNFAICLTWSSLQAMRLDAEARRLHRAAQMFSAETR